MSFPRYPKYKDSGVEWLGEVPEGWEIKKIKSFSSFSGGGTPSRENLAFWNGDIPWVSPKDMKTERIIGAEESISDEGLRSSSTTLIQANRLLMVVRSGILKHTIPVAINEVPVALNQDMKAIDFDDTLCASGFFLRWVQGLNSQLLLAWSKQGATVESIEHDYLVNTIVPLPPLEEQTAIAGFLDRETAKIDALVAEQKRLVELLKEKRQAVISHAVTKGLNPAAPMKPSGIEWLGEVPTHWAVGTLTRIAERIVVGIAEAATHAYVEVGTPILRATNVRPGKIIGEMLHLDSVFADDRGTKLLNAGDLVTVRTGNAGVTAVVPIELDGCQCFTMLITTLIKTSVADFYCYLMNGVAARCYFSLEGWGTAQINISVPILKCLPVPIPTLAEQTAIVEFLDAETAKIDALTAEAQRAIELLQERRTALISAAVTGKIDVRTIAQKETA